MQDCREKLTLAIDESAWGQNIGKYYTWTYEDFIAQPHTFIDTDIILDFTATADRDICADTAPLPDDTITPYHAAAQNMAKMPDLAACADFYIFIDYAA